MRVLYLGTPESSARCLEFLVGSGVDIVGVVTQPDRPYGRSLALKPPPVKEVAAGEGIPVFQPERASSSDVIEELRKLEPDITAVFAFGEFLSESFLAMPKISTVNLHLSLLPKYRGAAPVRWALVNGERVTGVTTFHIVKAMDAGDIIYQEETEIGERENSEELTERLTELGSRVMLRTLRDLYAGEAPRIPQDHSLATRAPKLKKTDGLIDWTLPAGRLRDFVRGMYPWPCAYSYWRIGDGSKMVRIPEVEIAGAVGVQPGLVFAEGNELCIGTGEGAVKVVSAQLEGRKRVSGVEFLNGHREILGAVLGVCD